MSRITIITVVLRFLNALPDAVTVLAAKLLAGLLVVVPNRRTQRAEVNLRHNLPELSEEARVTLLKAHLLHRALGFLEAGNLWYEPEEKLLSRVSEVHGWGCLQTAHDVGRGVIVAVPHFGAWEMTGLYLSAKLDNTAILYKAPEDPAIQRLIENRRGRAGARLLSANRQGMRGLLAILKQSGYVGILPDQRPRQGDGIVAPLFKNQVSSMTLLVRLARRTGARIVFAGCQRLADHRSFALHILTADEDIYAVDERVAVIAMNRMIERIAAVEPAQYQWSYNRDSSKLP